LPVIDVQAANAAAMSATIVKAVKAVRRRISLVLLEFRLLRLDLAGYGLKGGKPCATTDVRGTRVSASVIRTKTMERLESKSGGKGIERVERLVYLPERAISTW